MSDVLRMIVERTVYGQKLYSEQMVTVQALENLGAEAGLLLHSMMDEAKAELDKHEREIKTKKVPLP